MKTYLLMAATVVIQPAASLAQTAPPAAGFQQVETLGSGRGVVVFQGGGRGGRGGMTLGKPYSATAVTHTVQVLADGSQIERTQSEVLYRDEQGRTRSETNEGKFIQIVDRVAGVIYSLDATMRTARATETMAGGRRGANAGATQPQAVEELKAMADRVKAAVQEQSVTDQARRTPNLATEDLGTQFVNGVQAKGVRTTSTIPVGAIGNNRELKTVSERWESRELGVMVKSVNTDPRFGTTTYDLTNLSQSAPDPALFRVPADYTILQARN